MKLKDNFSAKGEVHLKLICNKTGKIIDEMINRNLIVKTGRVEVINMLAGDATEPITKMQIGSGGADPGTPFIPIPPANSDMSLAESKGVSDISATIKDLDATNPRVTFSALFSSLTIDSVVNEVGLFFHSNTVMFARHTFKTVPLDADSDFSLQVNWAIEF